MIFQSIRMAFKSILSNKMRSFLTVLGIVIGIISVTVLVSIGQGTTSAVTSSIEGLGTNLLTVSINTNKNNPLTMDDLIELSKDSTIGGIAPTVSQMNVTAKAGTVTYDEASVIGTTPGYDSIRNQHVTDGRFITVPDLDNRAYVAVIGVTVAEELFGTRNAVGETLSIGGSSYTVVGILEEKGTSATGSSDTQIIIPFTLAQRLYSQPKIRSFYVSASTSDNVDMAETVVRSYLESMFPNTGAGSTNRSGGWMTRMFGSSSSNKNTNSNFSINNQSDMLDALGTATASLTMMLAGIAAISLLVGGIGIMNIMLVSVSERTREIGIRKAIGAARGNILVQFLIEALVVSLLGGLLGIVVSLILMQILSNALSMTLTMSLGVAELAIGFSLLIGVIFGLYPANKASKLRPIDALRYDG